MYKSLIPENTDLVTLLEEISEVSRYLWEKGWAERNAGNLSVRITGMNFSLLQEKSAVPVFALPTNYPELGGEVFLITGTGRRMREIAAQPCNHTLVIAIDSEGTHYQVLSHSQQELDKLRPSSELASHLAIHQYLKANRPEKKVVVHTHPNDIIALTHSPEYREEEAFNRLLWGMHPESMVILPAGIGMVPYVLTGSVELGLQTIKALEGHEVVVWEKHGCLAVAERVEEAFDLIDVVAKSVDIYFKCCQAGFRPEGLTSDQLQDLRKLATGLFP